MMALFAVCNGGRAVGWMDSYEKKYGDVLATRVESVVRDVRSVCPEHGTVQVLDAARGGLHALLHLRRVLPTRFLYGFPLLLRSDSDYVKGMRAEFAHDLEESAAPCIVIYRQRWPPGDSYARLRNFPEFQALLDRDYALAIERKGSYRLYVRR